MPGLNQPSSAVITANQNTRTTGRVEVSQGQNDGHLWSQGLLAEQLYMILFMHGRKSGRFFLQLFFNFFGAKVEGVKNTVYNWREMEDWRQGSTVVTASAVGAATITITTARTTQYVLENDVFNLNNGISAFVDSVTINGTPAEEIVLRKVGGGNWAAGEINVGDLLGYSHNLFAEGTGQPGSRRYSPENRHNRTMIIKTTSQATGSAKTELGDLMTTENGTPYWYKTQEWIDFEEHCRKIENALGFAYYSDDPATPSTEGIFRTVEAQSPFAEYVAATGITEADLREAALLLHDDDDSEEFLGLLGSNAYYGLQGAPTLRDYFINGGVQYGSMAEKKKLALGMKIASYQYGDKTLHFREYKGFNDTNVTGLAAGGPSATVTDYKDFGIFLNMGHASGLEGDIKGQDLIGYCYKEGENFNRAFVHNEYNGMTGKVGSGNAGNLDFMGNRGASPRGTVQSDIDEDKTFMLSEIGAKAILPRSKHFFIRATS